MLSAMAEIDKRNLLEGEVFKYRVIKDEKVFIYWHDKQIKILKGKEARRFIDKIAVLNHKEAQLVMAKATGNFKHGNERTAYRLTSPSREEKKSN
jgi:hypothetical protein